MGARRARGGNEETAGTDAEGTNAVLVANVRGLAASRAVNTALAGFEASIRLPEKVDLVVMGGLIDVETASPIWEAALARWNGEPPRLETRAQRFPGQSDTVGKFQIIDIYAFMSIFMPNGRLVGMLRPGQRPVLARWSRRLERPADPPAEFAQAALSQIEDGALLALTIDMSDLLSPRLAEEVLRNDPALRDQAINLDLKFAAPALASIRSIIFSVFADDTTRARVRLDFGQSPRPLDRVAFDPEDSHLAEPSRPGNHRHSLAVSSRRPGRQHHARPLHGS